MREGGPKPPSRFIHFALGVCRVWVLSSEPHPFRDRVRDDRGVEVRAVGPRVLAAPAELPRLVLALAVEALGVHQILKAVDARVVAVDARGLLQQPQALQADEIALGVTSSRAAVSVVAV